MHMVGRRGAAFGTVINHEVSRPGCCEIEHAANVICDLLQDVLVVDDGEVTIHDWIRVEIHREIATKRYALLLRIQIFGTKEARAFRRGLTINRRSRAREPMRNMPDEDLEPVDPFRPCLSLG